MDSKISVLIPTYNRPDFLKEALESVVKQTLLPYELIVADDNMDENISKINRAVIEEFSKKYPFVVYHKNDKNLGSNRNYANLFKLASGDIIQFLGDDDLLFPDALEKLAKPLIENKEIKLTAGKTFFANKDKTLHTKYFSIFLQEYATFFNNKIVDGYDLIINSLQKKYLKYFW
ncbi:MAG: glycosyltransferase family A protein [Hydrogenothermaceae bacterium]